jgi:hypothetical protein
VRIAATFGAESAHFELPALVLLLADRLFIVLSGL